MASMEITSGWVKAALWSFDGSRRIRGDDSARARRWKQQPR